MIAMSFTLRNVISIDEGPVDWDSMHPKQHLAGYWEKEKRPAG